MEAYVRIYYKELSEMEKIIYSRHISTNKLLSSQTGLYKGIITKTNNKSSKNLIEFYNHDNIDDYRYMDVKNDFNLEILDIKDAIKYLKHNVLISHEDIPYFIVEAPWYNLNLYLDFTYNNVRYTLREINSRLPETLMYQSISVFFDKSSNVFVSRDGSYYHNHYIDFLINNSIKLNLDEINNIEDYKNQWMVLSYENNPLFKFIGFYSDDYIYIFTNLRDIKTPLFPSNNNIIEIFKLNKVVLFDKIYEDLESYLNDILKYKQNYVYVDNDEDNYDYIKYEYNIIPNICNDYINKLYIYKIPTNKLTELNITNIQIIDKYFSQTVVDNVKNNFIDYELNNELLEENDEDDL